MTRKNTVILIIAVVIVAIIAVIAIVRGTGTSMQDDDSSKVLKTISVSEVTRSVFYSPQYVAIAAGYFEDEGLKLDLTTGQGADNDVT